MYFKNLGHTIAFDLSEVGYEGYIVECRYKYSKSVGKYAVSMWLRRKDIDDRFRIEHQEIDTQYVSGTQDNIRDHIARIVEQACKIRFFDPYVERFEYTYKCFDLGDTLMEKERGVS